MMLSEKYRPTTLDDCVLSQLEPYQEDQQAASGAMYYKATKALVVTSSTFTDAAKKLAKSLGVKLVARNELSLLWTRTFPEKEFPAFTLAEYERQKPLILKELKVVSRRKHFR